MKIHHVRYFLALCKEQNFSRAAKRCSVTQPSLTNGIKDLEGELGGQLFHRDRSGIRMTELGKLMQPYMQRVQLNCELARNSAREFIARPRPKPPLPPNSAGKGSATFPNP